MPAVLVLVDDVDAPGPGVDDHRLGVARAVGVLHDVLDGLDGLVLEDLRLRQLVDPHIGPGDTVVVADVADPDLVVGPDGDGLDVTRGAHAGHGDPGDGLAGGAVDGIQVRAGVLVVVGPVDARVLPRGGEPAGLGDPGIADGEALVPLPVPVGGGGGHGGGQGEGAHEQGPGEEGEGSTHAPSLPSRRVFEGGGRKGTGGAAGRGWGARREVVGRPSGRVAGLTCHRPRR